MPQLVDVPTVGTVEFPDGMGERDIALAIYRNYPHLRPDSDGFRKSFPEFTQAQPEQPAAPTRQSASPSFLSRLITPTVTLPRRGEPQSPIDAPTAEQVSQLSEHDLINAAREPSEFGYTQSGRPNVVPQQTDPVGNAAINQGAGLAEFATSPVGAATAIGGPILGAIGKGVGYGAGLARGATRAIAAAYAAWMAHQVPESARQFGEATVTGTPQEKVEKGLGMVANIVLPGLLGKAAAAPGLANDLPFKQAVEQTFTPEQLKEIYGRVNRGQATPDEEQLVRSINESEAPGAAVRQGVTTSQPIERGPGLLNDYLYARGRFAKKPVPTVAPQPEEANATATREEPVRVQPERQRVDEELQSQGQDRQQPTVQPQESVETIAGNRLPAGPVEPSEAQKEAGNYKKEHISFQGLPISIENKAGSIRSGTDKGGKPWQVTMPADYGYIKRTEGKDGDHVDVYVGPFAQSQNVYVVDQRNLETGKFDEHKVMLGFNTPSQAAIAYKHGFSDGKGLQRIGAMTPMTVDEFKAWLSGDTTKPIAMGKPVTTTEQALGIKGGDVSGQEKQKQEGQVPVLNEPPPVVPAAPPVATTPTKAKVAAGTTTNKQQWYVDEMKRRGLRPDRLLGQIDVDQFPDLLKNDPLIAQIRPHNPELATRMEVGNASAPEIRAALAAIRSAFNPADWRVTVQQPDPQVPGSRGYVQLDQLANGQNVRSASRETLAKEGIETPDFSRLPQGQYPMAEAMRMLTAKKKEDHTREQSRQGPALAPREQKKYLLAELDKAIGEAPDEAPANGPALEHEKQMAAIRAEAFKAAPGYEGSANRGAQQRFITEKVTASGLLEHYQIPLTERVKGHGTTPAEIAAAPVTDQPVGAEDRIRLLNRAIEAVIEQSRPHVTIHVPGDGTFSVVNRKVSLEQFRKEVSKRFPVSTPSGAPPERRLPEPTKLPTVKENLTVADAVKALDVVASTDESRTAILKVVFADGKHLVATDGRRMLVVTDVPGIPGTDKKVVILSSETGKPKKDHEDNVPNWRQVIPERKLSERRFKNLPTDSLFSPLKQALALQKDTRVNSVTLYRNPDGSAAITTRIPDFGEYEHNLQPGATVLGAYNTEYLFEGITTARQTGSANVDIYISNELSPMEMVGKHSQYVLMPMRMGQLAAAKSTGLESEIATEPVSAIGVEEIRKLVSNDTGLPEPVRKAVLAMLDSPVMRDLDWTGLKLELRDRLEDDFSGVTTGQLIEMSRQESSPSTFPHEVFHLLWQLLPPHVRAEVDAMRVRSMQAELQTIGDPNARQQVASLFGEWAHQPWTSDQFMQLMEALRQSDPQLAVGLPDFYHLLNPSEFLSWFASERFTQDQNRFTEGATRSIWQKIKDWLAGLLKAIKGMLNLKRHGMEQIYQDLLAGRYRNTVASGVEYERQASLAKPSKGERTQVMGEDEYVRSRPHLTPESHAASLSKAKQLFDAAGVPVVENAALGGWEIQNDGFEHNIEGRKLAGLLEKEIGLQNQPGKAEDYLASVLNSIVLNFEAGKMDQVFDLTVRNKLFEVSQSERSFRGRMLSALAQFGKGMDFVARNPDVVLGRIYSDAFGGDQLRAVMGRMLDEFRGYFTDAEIEQALKDTPDLQRTVDQLVALNRRDEGGRVYRRVQQLLKPKSKAKLAKLETNARVEEAARDILQQAAKQGIEPKPNPNKKLSALQRLLLMVDPKTAPKIQALVDKAVKDAERNAGIAAALKEAPDNATRSDLEGRFAAGEEPTPEQVESGLSLPQFSHWKVIRDNLLGYSPVTVALAQDVIKGDFRNVRFSPAQPKPAEVRINLGALAKEPEVEVRRVLDAWMTNVGQTVNLDRANGETRERIRSLLLEQVQQQIAARRKEFLDLFFDPKRIKPVSASTKLQQILNAGVARDPRFQSGRVQMLIKKVASTYLAGEDMGTLAQADRTTKTEWLNRKLQQISTAENFGARLDAKDYLEAVTWTALTERLQAAEEQLVRQFLGGKDVEFTREPVTPEKRAASVAAATSKLEGLLHAGALDTPMIERVALKSAVQRLTPRMPELIKQIFETPFYRQPDLKENFASVMVEQLGMDEAQTDKAWEVFKLAFDAKQRVARQRALAQIKKSMLPQTAALESKLGKSGARTAWQIVERLVNAYDWSMDEGEMLREIAKARGWQPPTEDEFRRLRSLVDQEERLRELTDKEKDGLSAKDIEKVQAEKAAFNEGRRAQLKKEMAVMWARLTKPINLPMTSKGAWTSIEGFKKSWSDWFYTRRNLAAAANEWTAAGLLLKIGFPTRQIIGVASQMLTYTPGRALAQAEQLHREAVARGEPSALGHLITAQLKDAYTQRVAAMRATFQAIKASAMGRTEQRNVDRLMSGIVALDRLQAKGEEMVKRGDRRGYIFQLLALQRLGYRAAQALDQMQGIPAEFQERRYLVIRALREAGKSEAEARAAAEFVMGDMNTEFPMAFDKAQAMARAQGEKLSDSELKERAWRLVRAWQEERTKALELPVDDFASRIDLIKNTIGYNERETKGIGGVVATTARAATEWAEGMGVPLPFFRFGNAIGITINRALAFTPFYWQADLGPGESGWFKTETDRKQRKWEGLFGTAIGTIIAGLVLSGLLKVRGNYPRDEQERELWDAQGIKPHTLEIPVGDGHVVLSLNNSPVTPLAPYLAGSGALTDLLERRQKEQDKLNAEAAKLGLQPGTIRPMDMADMMGVAGMAAYQAVMGGRTASGLIGSLSEFGNLNVKKLAASQISPLIPFLPAAQELSRMGGVVLDTKMASFWDFMLPLPSSGARKVNMLGDPVGTQDAAQRVFQVLTGGSYPYVANDQGKTAAAYSSLFASGYRPPSVNPGRGYNVNGTFRPLNDEELAKYTTLRGERAKQKLTAMGVTDDPKAVQAVFQQANAEALQAVGVTLTPRQEQQAMGSQPTSGGVRTAAGAIGGGAVGGYVGGLKARASSLGRGLRRGLGRVSVGRGLGRTRGLRISRGRRGIARGLRSK